MEDELFQVEIRMCSDLEVCQRILNEIKKTYNQEHYLEEGVLAPYELCLDEEPLYKIKQRYDAFIKQLISVGLQKFAPQDEDGRLYSAVEAYGASNNVLIYFEKSGEYISRVGVILDIEDDQDLIHANKLLSVLNSLGECFLVDWGWMFIGALDDRKIIDEYLEDRLRIFSTHKH